MLELKQQITDTTIISVSEKSTNDMESPAFVPIDSVNGSNRVLKFQMVNSGIDTRYLSPSVSIDTSEYGSLPTGMEIRLLAKTAKPSAFEWDDVASLNTISLDTMEPGDTYIIWMNVRYSGAISQNLVIALEETISNLSIKIDTLEEAV